MLAENIQEFAQMIDKDTNGKGVHLVTGDGVKKKKKMTQF